VFAIQTRRIHAVVLATLLLLVLGVVASGQAQAASPCDTRQYSDRTESICSTTPVLQGTGWVIGYRDSVRNRSSSNISATCTATTSTTVTYSLSVTVGVEAKAWIFAKISASVTGGVAKSMSTGYSTSATFTVKPGKVMKCDRGVVTQRASAVRTTTTTYKNSRPTTVNRTNFTVAAPSRGMWDIYPG